MWSLWGKMRAAAGRFATHRIEFDREVMRDLYRRNAELESLVSSLKEDIATHQRVEAERDRVASIFDYSEDAIYSCSLQGSVTSWNKAAERMYEYSVREMLGRDIACLTEETRREGLQALHEKIAKGERIVGYEHELVTRSGRKIPVSMTCSPIYDLRNRLAGYSVISRDISQRIAVRRELALYRERLERLVAERTNELVRAKEKAHQAERLASIGALAAGIAHEINNPIGAMLLAAQNALEVRGELRSVQELSDMLERLATKVVENSERCGGIVRGVLQFARKQGTDTKPTDINAVVSRCVSLVRETLDSPRVGLSCELAPHLPPLRVNPVELEQVIVNLLSNACQSSDRALSVKVSTSRTASGIRLIIEDNGRGIPEEQRARIFDPFYTTRLEQGGTGLGLSIVHGIVTGYHGSIDVRSEVGRGTQVVVDLPFDARRERCPLQENASHPESSVQQAHSGRYNRGEA
ncbi:MAG: PAS domain S-box protein [Deltaproteobacteria bacterium]|nr:PAS domain S-box protein [Deltaproteobacteria bacterium]